MPLPPDSTRDAILQWLRSAAFLFKPDAAEVMELVAQNIETGAYIRQPATPPVVEVFGSRWEKAVLGRVEPSPAYALYVEDVVTHHGVEHYVVQDCPKNGGAILRNPQGANVQATYEEMLLVRRAPGRIRFDLPWIDRPIDATITRHRHLPAFTVQSPDSLRLADLPGPIHALPKPPPTVPVLPRQTWYAFECDSSAHDVILDVRLDGESAEPLVVQCPLCAHPMRHRGTWPATENGFGGLPDDLSNVLRYARRAADLHGDEYPACWDLGQAIDALDAAILAKKPLDTSTTEST